MTRLVRAATRHPFIAFLCLAATAVPLGLLVATAAPPDPGVRQLPLPAGVDAMACEYRARADFIQSPVRTSTMYFPAVKVTITR